MFSSFVPLSVPKFGFGKTASKGSPINISPVQVFDVEILVEKRDRRLKHLLKLNHTNFSILFNKLRFHNHTPHILGSAYLLSCTAEHLSEIYEDAATGEGHEPWEDSPSEIALHDYREFLGHREYQRAFVDFFEDQMVLMGYDWKAVVEKFLFDSGSKNSPNPLPMFNSMNAGLCHGLIHLGYAYELNSREVAMEALGLIATCYDPILANLLKTSANSTSTANPLTYSTSNPFEVLARLSSDTRLDKDFGGPGSNSLKHLLTTPNLVSILLEHWNAWKIKDSTKQFEQSQQLATALLISTAKSVGGPGYDFFLVHILTSSHAVRILIPFLDPKYHLELVREWWLIALAIYIVQGRPIVKLDNIRNFELDGRDWAWAEKQAVEGPHKFDAHYVKGVRAMKECAKVWGDEDTFYLKAAVKFASEFDGFGGFSEEDYEM